MSRVLITGAAGYLGAQLGQRLARRHEVLGLDIRQNDDLPFTCLGGDIRDPALADLIRERRIDVVVHLAAVLEDSGDRWRDYDIDVNGTRNVLDACVAGGVRQIVVTSSGAAYGYHADNPAWIDEHDPLRGNPEFAYSDHKRQVEELLAGYRRRHPALRQLVLRPGTVLGEHTDNQITALFERKRLLAIAGAASPFVFIWDQDVVAIIAEGVERGVEGIYNLAGDGALGVAELAAIMGKPVLTLPAGLLRGLLALGHALGLSRHSPAQINFLRYRPVLSNRRLKEEFGYLPEKTSEQVFRLFVVNARARGRL
jgi:UDP-glucose 4-epimerase